MNLMQAQELGNLLRGRRLELGLSTHQLGAQVGVRQSTIVRIEKGRFASPRPDKLARIAKALGIRSTDIYAQAGYLVRDELPSLGPYLSAKYPNMPEEAVAQVQREPTPDPFSENWCAVSTEHLNEGHE